MDSTESYQYKNQYYIIVHVWVYMNNSLLNVVIFLMNFFYVHYNQH